MIGVEYPVMAFNHCRDVVAAVSNAGGCGVLGAIALTPKAIHAETAWLRDHTDKPFGIDLVFPPASPETATKEQLLSYVPQDYRDFVDGLKQRLGLPNEIPGALGDMELGIGGTHEWERQQLEAVLDVKPPIMAAGLGITPEAVKKCQAAGIKVFTLVGNVKNARRAAALGVDCIVAQGTEAGGHTGRIGTLALVPQVVDGVAPIPVLAAGGIGDGRGLVAALALGAIGVWTGTIWLTSHEDPMCDWIKDSFLAATDEDAVITKAYTGKTCRMLNNEYVRIWNQPDAPKTLPMPLQNFYSPMPLVVSSESPETVNMFDKDGVREWVSAPAGNVVGLIKKRRPARQIIYDMISEAVEILGSE